MTTGAIEVEGAAIELVDAVLTAPGAVRAMLVSATALPGDRSSDSGSSCGRSDLGSSVIFTEIRDVPE